MYLKFKTKSLQVKICVFSNYAHVKKCQHQNVKLVFFLSGSLSKFILFVECSCLNVYSKVKYRQWPGAILIEKINIWSKTLVCIVELIAFIGKLKTKTKDFKKTTKDFVVYWK